jgi:hypothetical protein
VKKKKTQRERGNLSDSIWVGEENSPKKVTPRRMIMLDEGLWLLSQWLPDHLGYKVKPLNESTEEVSGFQKTYAVCDAGRWMGLVQAISLSEARNQAKEAYGEPQNVPRVFRERHEVERNTWDLLELL